MNSLKSASREEHRLRHDVIVNGDRISIPLFSKALRVSGQELTSAAGISSEAAKRPGRANSATSQRGLREMLEIIDRVTPWAGSPLQAFAWYRSEPIPAFGQMTPEQIVKAGYVEAFRSYLDGIAVGGYA